MSHSGIAHLRPITAASAVLLLAGTMLLATGIRSEETWAETAITVGAVMVTLAYIVGAYP